MATANSDNPGLFADIGKKAKDLLHKGFSTGHMLFFSHVTSVGATISTTSIISDGLMIGTVSSSFSTAGLSSNLSVSTLNQVTAETIYEDVVPGLKLCVSTSIPDAKSLGKAELIYQNKMASFTAFMKGLTTTPVMEYSANLGTAKFCTGGSLCYDSANNLLLNTTVGLGYNSSPFSLGVLLRFSEGRNLNAYCLHELSPYTSLAFHADLHHEKRIGSVTIGGLHRLNPQTSVKVKVNNAGILSAFLEHELKPLVTVGLSAEVNCQSLNKETPNVGLSVTVLSV